MDKLAAEGPYTTYEQFKARYKSIANAGIIETPKALDNSDEISNIRTAVQSNSVFVEDFSAVRQFTDPKQASFKYAPNVVGFFCKNAKRGLFLPLAIKIIDTGLTYAKQDSAGEWQLAKMALASSELNWRQVLHYVNTHIIFIPIQVELIRSMPEAHPIYALLNYHLYGDLAIEYLGNKVLFSLGTNYDKVGAFGATGFLRAILDELSRSSVIRDYPAEIEERGLKHLPRSRYVKYGAKYYDIFKTFITAYVHTYYPSKRSIQTDSELQTGASRCSALQGINDFPSSFQGFDDLIKIVTNFIFQSAVRHHFMNGRVLWATIAAPFSPAALYNVPLPTKKGVAVNPMDYAIPSDLFPTAPVTLLKAYATVPFSQEKNLQVPIAAFQLAMKGMEFEVTLSESEEDYPFNVVKPSLLPWFSFI